MTLDLHKQLDIDYSLAKHLQEREDNIEVDDVAG